MKSKNIIFIILLIAPILLRAQFKTDISFGAGINNTQLKRIPGIRINDFGFAFKAGIDIIYNFNENLGIGSGVYYSYHDPDIPINILGYDRSLKAISIPISMLYNINSSPIEVQLGVVANFSMNKKTPHTSIETTEFESMMTSLQLGCFYYMNKTLKLGILFDASLEPYFKVTPLNEGPPEYSAPIKHLYQRSLIFKLSYTLLRK